MIRPRADIHPWSQIDHSCGGHAMQRYAIGPCVLAIAASTSLAQNEIFVDSGQHVGENDFNGIALGLGDLDGDGDLDAVTGSYVQPSVVYLNDGAGVFTSTGQELPAALAARVIIRDFDGDGDNDVFILSHSLDTRILFNDGTGFLTPGGQNLGSLQTHGADAGDVDADGDIDLFVTNVNGHVNTVAFNDGTGHFTYSEQNNHPAGRDAAIADLDGDGDLDAFIARSAVLIGNPQENRVLLNDGKGNFTDTGQLLGNSFSGYVRLADFDGDGDVDAYVANFSFYDSDPADKVWLNDGAGQFTDSGQALGDTDNAIDVADLDADGDIDVFSSNGVDAPTVWLNDGNAVFNIAQTLSDPLAVTGQVALGKLDADADVDAFVLGGKPGAETVYFNVTGACPADVNADGSLDLLDFIAFQNAWVAQEPLADCDADGAFNVIDFVCFQDLFKAGCPK
jgi:hypothetical protein